MLDCNLNIVVINILKKDLHEYLQLRPSKCAKKKYLHDTRLVPIYIA